MMFAPTSTYDAIPNARESIHRNPQRADIPRRKRAGFNDQQLRALTWMLNTVVIDGVSARRHNPGSCWMKTCLELLLLD